MGNGMTRAEKKKYLKERKKWKLAQTVFIKDDSDNEQLTDDDDNNEEDEDLQYSGSEDEKEKQDRLAREALKSYSNAFQKDDAPEDYHLIMRKDVVEKELADDDETKYETVEDIERREKIEKMEQKEQEKKAKMREERLRRIQAFQAASMAREQEEEEEKMEDQEYEVSVTTEVKPAEENPFYSSYDAMEEKDELEDPLKAERERIREQQQQDEEELKKLNRQAAKKKAASGPVFEAMQVAPPKKKAKIEINQMSLGALKTMIDSEKEKIQKELKEEDEKTRMAEKEEEEARKKAEQEKEVSRKKAEQVLRRAKRKGDMNNPSKEEVDAAQELEQLTWQDRYMKNKKVKDVVEKSQLMSKVKNKLKEEQKKEKEQEGAPGASESASATSAEGETSKDDGGKEKDKGGMIGSIEEYANLVGTSVSKLADTKYEAPVVEAEEEDEDEESDNEGDDLWGAIMGGS